jgi:hypothetical protein
MDELITALVLSTAFTAPTTLRYRGRPLNPTEGLSPPRRILPSASPPCRIPPSVLAAAGSLAKIPTSTSKPAVEMNRRRRSDLQPTSSLEGGGTGGAHRVAEGENFLPQQLAGEAPGEPSGVAVALAQQLLCALLLGSGSSSSLMSWFTTWKKLVACRPCCIQGGLSFSGQMKCTAS